MYVIVSVVLFIAVMTKKTLPNRAVRLIEIKSRFEIARFLNRFIARFYLFFFINFFARPAPTSRSMLSEPIRMQQNRTDRAYRQIVC